MRRDLMFGLLAMAIVASVGLSTAHAQSWPSKPVRIIVPFPPAGTTDIVARSLGVELQKMWGQPVIIENRAGAGGNVGAEAVRQKPERRLHAADGHGRHACDQRGAVCAKRQQDAVRSGQGLRSDHASGGRTERDGDQSESCR